VVVEIRYRLNENLKGVAIGLNLARNGELLMCSFDTDENEQRFDERPAGTHVTRVFLPCPLKAGFYQVTNIGIGFANVGGIDSHTDVFHFNVEERSFDPTYKSFSRNRPGIMYTCLKWQSGGFTPNEQS
jgi:hypothetical protein